MYGCTHPEPRWDVHLSGAGNRTGKVACAVAGAVHPSARSHRAYQASRCLGVGAGMRRRYKSLASI